MIRDKYRIEGAARARYVKRHPGNDYYVWCDAYDGAHYACEWPL